MSDLKKRAVPILIGGYQIDASISESHQFESTVTEFPVEQGSAISDNIVPKSIMVTIEGIVSDTPIGPIATLRNQQAASSDFLPFSDPKAALEAVKGSTFMPSVDARTALLAIRDARQPITISTSIRTYENMALQTLEIPVDASTGAAFRFSATFKQIIIVTNVRTTIRTATKRTASPSGQGKKLYTKASAAYALTGSVAVFTRPSSERALWAARGFTGVADSPFGDHYEAPDSHDPMEDGYVRPNESAPGYHGGVYHPYATGNTGVKGLLGTSAPATINGQPVHYDEKSRTWVDSTSNSVVKKVPPGVDQFNFVTSPFGKNG
ncbi:MAG: hypothetical protein H0X39_00885 [Actinobacteria bacterium]|nr:hypothetical protein [Actinomycetota bacterium]